VGSAEKVLGGLFRCSNPTKRLRDIDQFPGLRVTGSKAPSLARLLGEQFAGEHGLSRLVAGKAKSGEDARALLR
jgi:hypothetical protein